MREGYLIVMLILIVSCQKNPPGDILPPPTTSGEHTLGFFVNGEAWIPYDRGSHEKYELPKAKLLPDGSLKISATRIDDEKGCRHWFCIEIANNFNGVGKYVMSSVDCNSPYQTFYYGAKRANPSEIYQINKDEAHFIEVTHHNESKQFVSGNFEFQAISNRNDTIQISSGRFDLRYE